jgi:hypothetical protein
MLTCCLINDDLKRMNALGGRGIWASFLLPWLMHLKDKLESLSSLSAGGNKRVFASAHSGSSGEVKEASVILGAKVMFWGSSTGSRSNRRQARRKQIVVDINSHLEDMVSKTRLSK